MLTIICLRVKIGLLLCLLATCLPSKLLAIGQYVEIKLLSGNGQTGAVSTSLQDPLVVELLGFDMSGNPVIPLPGRRLDFSVSSPPNATGAVLSSSVVVTGADGIASALLTLGNLPGQYQVAVTCDAHDTCSPINPAVFTESAVACESAQDPCIISPFDGASPQSQFIAITGTGQAGHQLNVLIEGVSVGSVRVDAEGKWEALPYLQIFPASVLPISVQDAVSLRVSNIISVNRATGTYSLPPPVPISFLPVRHADILISSSTTSLEYLLYGPNYTHSGVFVGGDNNGTPLVAEAVITSKLPPGTLTGTTRLVSLESSDLWNGVQRIAAFSPSTALTGSYRDAIVSYARSKATSPGLPYWSFGQVFAPLAAAYPLFVCCSHSTRYQSELQQMSTNKTSESTFQCATLVWRAYYEGTAHTLDISDPNDMAPDPRSIFGAFAGVPVIGPAFVDQIRPYWVIPETFVRSPKLKPIF